jgi:hypothetical protein
MLKLPLAFARSSAAAGGMGDLLIVLSTLPAQARFSGPSLTYSKLRQSSPRILRLGMST